MRVRAYRDGGREERKKVKSSTLQKHQIRKEWRDLRSKPTQAGRNCFHFVPLCMGLFFPPSILKVHYSLWFQLGIEYTWHITNSSLQLKIKSTIQFTLVIVSWECIRTGICPYNLFQFQPFHFHRKSNNTGGMACEETLDLLNLGPFLTFQWVAVKLLNI